MYRSISTIAVLCALAGCATSAGYEKLLTGWVNSDEVSLVRKWGAPSRTYAAADRTFLVYESRQDLVLPEVQPTYQTQVKGNKVYTSAVGGSPATTVAYVCTTTFEMKAGRVVGSRFTGNNCVARE
jgi:hypothetical protein